jgi:hypothetical protein
MFRFLTDFANRDIRRCLWFIAALILLCVSGCPKAPHSENVKPGDADYPAENPHPVDVIKLTVIIPASIKARLMQGYTTHRGGGSVDSGPPCAYIQTNSQARTQYGIAPALELTQMAADSYSGEVVLDRFLPGLCEWGFAGAWYRIGGDRDEAELLRVDRPERSTGNSRIDLWCLRRPKRDPRIPDTCMDIHEIRAQFPEEISATTLAEIEASGGGSAVPMYIAPGLQSLVIQFHDLAAPNRDLALRVN